METPTGQGVTNYVRGETVVREQTVVNSNSPNPFYQKSDLMRFTKVR